MTGPPPSSGVTLCEMLNILNGYDLRNLGFHSAASANYNIEAMRYAFYDRNRYLGDPNFVDNPIKTLLSEGYAKKIRQNILTNKAGDSKHLKAPKITIKKDGNTTHYVVIDRLGNAVSTTVTLNGFFGSKTTKTNTSTNRVSQLIHLS